MLKLCKLYACPNGTLGLHLSRAPWDPYPWVSDVQNDSSAQRAGVRNGDTVLEMNGRDVLGQKISQIAEHIGEHWKTGASYITMVIWRNQNENSDENSGNDEQGKNVQQHVGINQQSLQKFATCLQNIAQLLECPVCLEVIRPPGWQCCNGHVLCNNCRSRSIKCPVCRVPLGPRGRCLMSDKLFTLLAESFPCDGVRNNNDSTTVTNKCSPDFHSKPTMATLQPTNPKETTIKVKKTKSFQRQINRVPDNLDVVADDDDDAIDDNGITAVESSQATRKDAASEDAKADATDTTMTIKSAGNIARVCLRRTISREETGKVFHQLNEAKSQKDKFFTEADTVTSPTTLNDSSLVETKESFEQFQKRKTRDEHEAAQLGDVTWPSRRLLNKENNNNGNYIKGDADVLVKMKLKSYEKTTEGLASNLKLTAANNDNGEHRCTVITLC